MSAAAGAWAGALGPAQSVVAPAVGCNVARDAGVLACSGMAAALDGDAGGSVGPASCDMAVVDAGGAVRDAASAVDAAAFCLASCNPFR